MTDVPRRIRVFIASPGDLAVERRAFKDTIDSLNRGFGRGADVEFVPLGWEDALSQVGRRAQAQINNDVDACDLFVLAMWRRWGQAAPDAAPYTSYTEEEFYRALARYEKSGAPKMCVFFKHIDAGQVADPGEQLKKVLAFRRQLEETRKVLYRSFPDEHTFVQEIDRHLTTFAKNPEDLAPPIESLPLVPDSVTCRLQEHKEQAQKAVAEMEKLRKEAERATKEAEQARAEAKNADERARAAQLSFEAKLTARSIDLAELAAKAALDGRVEEARQSFAKVLDGTSSLQVLYLGYQFFYRIGELDDAERLLKRWLAISGRDQQTTDTAAALSNLGRIARTRGDLDAAEKLHRESLDINRKLGRSDGQASALGNLGIIARLRGQLDVAEELHRESLGIERKLGRLEGEAADLNNLGLIAQDRNELDKAEGLHRESLEINRRIGRLEGQAIALGNLGVIAVAREDLETAENLYRESLDIERKLGRLEGQAADLNNLGNIAKTRGDLDTSERLHREALDIERKLGRPARQARTLQELSNIAEARGDSTTAEKLRREALEIERKIKKSGEAEQP